MKFLSRQSSQQSIVKKDLINKEKKCVKLPRAIQYFSYWFKKCFSSGCSSPMTMAPSPFHCVWISTLQNHHLCTSWPLISGHIIINLHRINYLRSRVCFLSFPLCLNFNLIKLLFVYKVTPLLRTRFLNSSKTCIYGKKSKWNNNVYPISIYCAFIANSVIVYKNIFIKNQILI